MEGALLDGIVESVEFVELENMGMLIPAGPELFEAGGTMRLSFLDYSKI